MIFLTYKQWSLRLFGWWNMSHNVLVGYLQELKVQCMTDPHCSPCKDPFDSHWFERCLCHLRPLSHKRAHRSLTGLHGVFTHFQMEEEELTYDKKQPLAMLYEKLNKMKKYLNEGNTIPHRPYTVTSFSIHTLRLHCIDSWLFALATDDTDNINQVIGSNSPESCLSYLMDLEKKGDLHLNENHLTRLVDFYTRVFSNMPLGKHCQNESYARMLVRFAELKA